MLPITGVHLLMATDAPEQIGFRLKFGNNVDIILTCIVVKKQKDYLVPCQRVEKWKWSCRLFFGETILEVVPNNF